MLSYPWRYHMVRTNMGGRTNVLPKFTDTKIIDMRHSKSFEIGEFLGKGGFAACYRVTDTSTKASYAIKVAVKQVLKQSNALSKLLQEVDIHKKLSHQNVVAMYSAFEDSLNVYLLLELCERRSLMEMIQRRKKLTVPESRYLIKHLSRGLEYLHKIRIVHRDIKVGNLFLTATMVLKIGDFGLAFSLDQSKAESFVCGTPNYIAPEILHRRVHTDKVDIWSTGCVMYICLVGKPPFETASTSTTYAKIKNNDYRLPDDLMNDAKELIKACLADDPTQRPSAKEILQSHFLSGFIPKSLPKECVTTTPLFEKDEANTTNSQNNEVIHVNNYNDAMDPESTLNNIREKIQKVLASEGQGDIDDLNRQFPNLRPFYWVNRWVDYSFKYGFGYQICDGSFGCIFCDNRTVIVSSNGVDCIEKNVDGSEVFYPFNRPPKEVRGKTEILQQFQGYMQANLKPVAAPANLNDPHTKGRLVFVTCWMRINTAIAFLLSNSTLQINFEDHVKLLICPHVEAATVIHEGSFKTFSLKDLAENGTPEVLRNRLEVTLAVMDKMNQMIAKKTAERISEPV